MEMLSSVASAIRSTQGPCAFVEEGPFARGSYEFLIFVARHLY
jgi:hypothetical protein